MNWLESVSKAVSEGKTKQQFAIPDGEYVGNLFFITDKDNKILIALQWSGSRWVHEYETFYIQECSYNEIQNDAPTGLKPISIKLTKHDPNANE